MSQNFTQPEEINNALMEMAGEAMKIGMPIPDKKNLIGGNQKDWCGGYVSPYRAAHMKSIHGLFDQ